MKIIFFSDIHGNKIALDLFFDEIKHLDYDALFFLGDSVGYFPQGNEVIKNICQTTQHCLLGNHDAMLLNYITPKEENKSIYGINKPKISHESKNILKNWLPFYTMNFDGLNMIATHGTPFNPLLGYFYADGEIDFFKDLDYDVIIMGHTHRPFNKKINNKYILNVGSIGLPRDHGNKSSYMIWDSKNNSIQQNSFLLPVEQIINEYNTIHNDVKTVLRRNNI